MITEFHQIGLPEYFLCLCLFTLTTKSFGLFNFVHYILGQKFGRISYRFTISTPILNNFGHLMNSCKSRIFLRAALVYLIACFSSNITRGGADFWYNETWHNKNNYLLSQKCIGAGEKQARNKLWHHQIPFVSVTCLTAFDEKIVFIRSSHLTHMPPSHTLLKISESKIPVNLGFRDF